MCIDLKGNLQTDYTFLNVFLYRCWDINEDSPYWWIIKGPIVVSIAVKANTVARINVGMLRFCKQEL